MDPSSRDHQAEPLFVVTALEHAEEQMARDRAQGQRDALRTAARLLKLQRRAASAHTD
jgi:hypothetical protein